MMNRKKKMKKQEKELLSLNGTLLENPQVEWHHCLNYCFLLHFLYMLFINCIIDSKQEQVKYIVDKQKAAFIVGFAHLEMVYIVSY
jgi:hypothetical protein